MHYLLLFLRIGVTFKWNNVKYPGLSPLYLNAHTQCFNKTLANLMKANEHGLLL